MINHTRLKDPFSVRFRNTYLKVATHTSGEVVRVFCGELAAKNSHGAYTGFNRFFVFGTGQMFTIVEDDVSVIFFENACKDSPGF